jgi:arylsulfatase A-like enzyme
MYDPASLTVPQITPGEHQANPPHFAMTQQTKPDFSAWRESGFGIHGCSSHLHEHQAMAKNIGVYYGMISLMDKYIGRILDRLDALGLSPNTLVVFTSDHGHFYGQHGLNAKGPFHYEDLVRVPFIARHPGKIPAGQSSEALQSLVDLAPTFLSWTGITAPHGMAGLDQSAVWTGQNDSARDHTIVENRHEPTTIHVKTYVDQRYKLTVYYNQEYGELFDLQEDPGEINNLWNSPDHTVLKSKLIHKFLFAEMGKEPLSMPRIAGA